MAPRTTQQDLCTDTAISITKSCAARETFKTRLDTALPQSPLDTGRSSGKIAQAVYLKVQDEDFVLVKPYFAFGTYAVCSIWLGLKDRKLYVRKLQSTAQGQKPPDVYIKVTHPLVPMVAGSMCHGLHPLCPTQNNESSIHDERLWDFLEFANGYDLASIQWSSMVEYVNGPTLLTILEHDPTAISIPEAAIWQCAADLLGVVHTLRFPSKTDQHKEPIHHNDIFTRNIIVSTEVSEKGVSVSRFHLIDFGLATKQSYHTTRILDLENIAIVLCSMVLHQDQKFDIKRRFYMLRDSNEGEYSQALIDMIDQLFEVNSNAIPVGFPAEFWFEQWITRCKANADRETRRAARENNHAHIQFDRPLGDERPWLFDGECADDNFEDIACRLVGCSPYQRAWLDADTLAVLKVEDELTWNRPERALSTGHRALVPLRVLSPEPMTDGASDSECF